jgi:Holliday junction resolvase RusA-like endonuclease
MKNPTQKNVKANADQRIETWTFRVSFGVSDNRRHIVARGRFIDSREYRAWKQRAFFEIKSQMPSHWKPLNPTEAEQLPYHVQVFLPNRRMDAENMSKGLRDVMKTAGVYTDDKWAMGQFRPAVVCPKDPRILVTIPLSPIAGALMWPQTGLENVLSG